MRRSSLFLAVLLLSAACAIHINDGPPAAAPPVAATPRPAPAPAPVPAPVASPPSTAVPAHLAFRGVAPVHMATRPHYAPSLTPATPPQPPPNATVLAKLKANPSRTCGAHEVAPGVWVNIDCEPYTRVTSAKMHATFRKARLFRQGMLRADDASTSPARSTSDRGEAALPAAVDHRADGLEGPIKYQGQVGACSGFGLSAAMDNAIRRLGKTDTTSAAQVWANYGKPGMALAGDSNFQKGIVSVDAWPFDGAEACRFTVFDPDPRMYPCGDYYNVKQGSARSDPSSMKKVTDANAAGHFKLVAFDSIPDHPANIPDIMATLATGADLWIALELDIDYWRDSALAADKSIHDCVRCGETHAVALAGYRTTPTGRQFLIHNSWGTSWGDGGYAWVSENAVKNHMWWPYKVTMAEVGGHTSLLTDDDCAEDELVDSVTGDCGKICPDDSRPASGKCG
jgi:Papain family cysteine protease